MTWLKTDNLAGLNRMWSVALLAVLTMTAAVSRSTGQAMQQGISVEASAGSGQPRRVDCHCDRHRQTL